MIVRGDEPRWGSELKNPEAFVDIDPPCEPDELFGDEEQLKNLEPDRPARPKPW